MNPRRVHDLMRANFPAFDAATLDWMNVVDEHGALMNERAYAFIAQPFLRRGITEVLVAVERKTGDFLAIAQLTTYLGSHLGVNVIRIADRQFGTFAVLSLNGVATQWAK